MAYRQQLLGNMVKFHKLKEVGGKVYRNIVWICEAIDFGAVSQTMLRVIAEVI